MKVKYLLLVLLALCFNALADVDAWIKQAVPAGYQLEQSAESGEYVYVQYGDAEGSLKKAGARSEFDESYLTLAFPAGQVSSIRVRVINVPPAFRAKRDFQIQMNRSLKRHWGEHSFYILDDTTGVSHFINYAGAFFAVSTKVCGDELIVAESIRLADFLAVEDVGLPVDMSPASLLKHFYKAGNIADVEGVFKDLDKSALAAN